MSFPRKRQSNEEDLAFALLESGREKAGEKAGQVRYWGEKAGQVRYWGPADVRAIFTRARHFDFGPPFAGDPWDDRPTLGPNVSRFPSAIPAGQRWGESGTGPILKLGGPADVRAIFTRARHFDFGPPFAGDPWDDRPTLGPNVSRFPSAIPAGQRGGLVARCGEALPVPARRRFD